jgi:hypothetical protein
MKRLGLFLALGLMLPSVAFALPNEIAQEGLILDGNGLPFEGAHDIRIRLYPVPVGGAALFHELHAGVEFFEGYYYIALGSIEALDPMLMARPTLYMGVEIDGGNELVPRTPLAKVPAAMVADIALGVVGDINVDSVAIGGQLVVNDNGQWVGDPTGLVGPRGPAGAQGPQGVVGPAGAVGPGGANADPAAVAGLVVQELQRNPGQLPYLSKTVDDTADGNDITFNNGAKVLFRGAGVRNALDMGNNNIIGANSLRFADPGPNEGIIWDGTQAKIVVATLGDGNADGWLRLINDGGISLESNVRIQGDLSITGVISAVQRITATVGDFQTANIVNANITNLNGPGGRVNVAGQLSLGADVILNNANFIGVIRTGGVVSGGAISAAGNVTAGGSIAAQGNVSAGAAGRLTSGTGGIWVRNIQVFDGNGNLLRRPVYQCPVGRLFFGTDANGAARCVNVTCAAGSAFRGFDANLNPICEVDDGITAIPANTCPAGQAIYSIDAAGRTQCRSPRSGNQTCPEGEFMTGVTPAGTVICAEAPEGGGGAAAGPCEPGDVRPNVLVCSRASRNVASLIPAGFQMNVANGCAPNDQTQVMMVTRSGSGQAAGNAAAWAAYVQAGGMIITEYSASDEVFNAVFPERAAQGSRRGSCRDNAMPVVKLNPADPFWAANAALTTTPAQSSACGYEVGAYPGITALGGWTAAQVNVGYRTLGQGRVWFVDADWQDNQAMTASSVSMLGSMMTWCPAQPAGGDALEFPGVRNNVADADIVGWNRCHRSVYGDSNISVADILRQCDGAKIMYGCRRIGQDAWQVLGQGDRASVFRDTGNSNVPTVNNGIGWYFSATRSLGFAPQGQAISRNSCDTQNGEAAKRICWHSSGGNMNGGWRCGANTGLNGDRAYERVIWSIDPNAGGGNPPPNNALAFSGVRQNTPDAALVGWNACHTSRYGATVNNLTADLAANCDGAKIMYGCRPVGAANWTLLAQGDRAQVLRDTGRGNATTRHNGVEWYFNASYSIGFAPEGQPVSRNSCDTQNGRATERMCWHSNGDRLTSGYRCGTNFLNGNNNWERRIWTTAAAGAPPADRVFASCKAALAAGFQGDGVYRLQPPGEAERRVRCDQTTDGGGWTLVGSTRNTTFDDKRSNYYDDLQRLDPAAAHDGIWWGLRQAPTGRFDVRFACRDALRAADAPMTVDLSVYDVNWYMEWTTGTDAQSCFSESNGGGDDNPPPMRKNNLNNQVRNRGDQWNAGYLEGEDSCGDTGDFTIDFDDRGMDNNQSDGTDWGEDDSAPKCGRSGLGSGQWFVWARERADFGGGPPADRVFATCRAAKVAGYNVSGLYRLRPPNEAERWVWCDQTTDGGGWTLVGSTEGSTMNDQRSNYYNDLQTLDPAGANAGIWWGLRGSGARGDVRFACRNAVRAADSAMTVDLSVYNVNWYQEWTTGTDAQSCFSERNGGGDDNPPPMRKNNLNNQVRARGDQWNAGYLEGEDSCGDSGDFTIDYDDRGMDSNQNDGTDWGEDDSSKKCGRSGLGTGQWFIFYREAP